MAAWNTPPMRILTRFAVTTRTRARSAPHPALSPEGRGGSCAVPLPRGGRGQGEGEVPARSDLPAVDPLDELGARGLHRYLRRHDLDGIDGDEVVAILVGGDALVEVTHLHVVGTPRARAGERLCLEAFERLGHLRLGRPLLGLPIDLLGGDLVRLRVEIRVIALVGGILVVLRLVV